MDFSKISKGQYVVYGTNGICLVEDISEMAFPTGSEQKPYLILRPLSDRGSTIYIPHDNELLLSRMRPLLTKKEASALLNGDCAKSFLWNEDRKQRILAFKACLSENDLAALLPMIRCICQKRDQLSEKNKKLSTADRELLSVAVKTVCDELSFVLGDTHESIAEALQSHLEIAL